MSRPVRPGTSTVSVSLILAELKRISLSLNPTHGPMGSRNSMALCIEFALETGVSSTALMTIKKLSQSCE